MNIKQANEQIVITCDKNEAKVIAALLGCCRDDCAWGCPYLELSGCENESDEICGKMSEQLWASLKEFGIEPTLPWYERPGELEAWNKKRDEYRRRVWKNG